MTTLLIVDDDTMTRRIAENRLVKMGYQVISEKCGHDALDRIEQAQVNLVLLDQVMPELDGLSTYRLIHQKAPFLPVIMATFHGSTTLAVEFLKQGGADFIQKPVDFDVLEIKIRRILKSCGIEQEIRTSEIEKIAFQEAECMKQVIAASLSHELRTPLNFIRSVAGSLKQALLTGEIAVPSCSSRIEDLRHAWTMLNDGINELIETALIEKGEPLHLTGFSLEDLIGELVQKAQNMAFSKGFTELEAEIDPAFPLLWTDRKKLKRILLNILDNAVRYTEKGAIYIRVVHEMEKKRALISVKDSGPGVPEAIVPSVFNRFTNGLLQGDQSISGAGLYLSKKLIDLLKGEIWFESSSGKGTTFFISLPLGIGPVC
jgi:signal transduction histidine kinase